MKAVVVAGNSLQYHEWLHLHGLNGKASADYKLVMQVTDILGFKDIPAYAVGTFYQLKEADLIRQYVFTHNMDPDLHGGDL